MLATQSLQSILPAGGTRNLRKTAHLNDLETCLQRLFARINYERQMPGNAKSFDLSKMHGLMHCLGDPHLEVPVVHVAGTKGKGSVCVMAGNILTAAGFRTGVYTSPHMESVNQRMAIDGVEISDAAMLALFEHMEPIVTAYDAERLAEKKRPVTFFEFTTAMAFSHFAKSKCDIVVLETGLGGRLDSTNVCQPLLSVVTNISLDHTRILGDTVEQIAAEKGGIIKPMVPVILGATDQAATEVLSNIADQRGSHCYLAERDFGIDADATDGTFSFHIRVPNEPNQTNAPSPMNEGVQIDNLRCSMRGEHQRHNAALAIMAVMLLRNSGWTIDDDAIRSGLMEAGLPGRIEVITGRPTLVMDMAHNPASIRALIESLRNDIPAWKTASEKVLIFATTRDKDCRRMLELLLPIFDRVIFTQYQNNPRGMPVESLLETGRAISDQGQADNIAVETIATPGAAVERALASCDRDALFCIAGSLFLISELREQVQQLTQA